MGGQSVGMTWAYLGVPENTRALWSHQHQPPLHLICLPVSSSTFPKLNSNWQVIVFIHWRRFIAHCSGKNAKRQKQRSTEQFEKSSHTENVPEVTLAYLKGMLAKFLKRLAFYFPWLHLVCTSTVIMQQYSNQNQLSVTAVIVIAVQFFSHAGLKYFMHFGLTTAVTRENNWISIQGIKPDSPIQTSPKQPCPSFMSRRRDSLGISQASFAKPWVWGFSTGHMSVRLWHNPSACSGEGRLWSWSVVKQIMGRKHRKGLTKRMSEWILEPLCSFV